LVRLRPTPCCVLRFGAAFLTHLGVPAVFKLRFDGGYIFENEWQSFRTRQNRDLELATAMHTYDRPGRYIVAVKVIDIFGNDTMTLVPVNVG
jgi:site-specific DNA-methyltransferase (adenine-specific)/adenine-specific DNA-methyltransferase